MGHQHRFRLNPTVLLMTVALWPGAAAAQPAQAEAPLAPQVTELRTQFAASINNLGVQQSLEWSRRRRLALGSGSLRSDAHVQFGATAALTPSFARIGLWGQVAPVSMLVVRVGVEPAYFFGTFNSLMSFDRRDEPFDADARKARGGAAAGRATRLYVTPTLRARLGRVVAMATGDVERWSSSVTGPLFYEPTRDTLLKTDGDSVLALRHIVMYEHVKDSGTRVSFGAIHTWQRVGGSQLNQVQKLGAIVTLQSDGRLVRLSRPVVTVTAARYLDDPAKERSWTATVSVSTSLRRR